MHIPGRHHAWCFLLQEWAVQLSERNWRNAVLLHNTNLFLHDWLKRAALKEAFCAFCCRSGTHERHTGLQLQTVWPGTFAVCCLLAWLTTSERLEAVQLLLCILQLVCSSPA